MFDNHTFDYASKVQVEFLDWSDHMYLLSC